MAKAKQSKGNGKATGTGRKLPGNANQQLYGWLAKQSEGATGVQCQTAMGTGGIPNVLKHWVVAGYASRTSAKPTTYSATAKGIAAAKGNGGLVPAVPTTNPAAHRLANGQGQGQTITGAPYTVSYAGNGMRGRAAWGKPVAKGSKGSKGSKVATVS